MAKTTKKAKKAKGVKRTYIGIVIDRSGSMTSCQHAAWQGLNEQIKTIKECAEQGGDTSVTIVQFDNEFEILRNNVSATTIHEVDSNEYQPRGSTALLDAVGQTIGMLEVLPTTDDTGFLVIVISDGEENASHIWSGEKLRAKVAELEKSGQWTFTYMLANTDMYNARQLFGAHVNNTMAYNSTPIGTATSFGTTGQATVMYMNARSSGLKCSADFYSQPSVTVTPANSSLVIPSNFTVVNNAGPAELTQKQKDDLKVAIDNIKSAINTTGTNTP